jgi:hypothetical protein
MPAIITDQFRILNAETFAKSVTGIGTTSNFYYTFLAHPNPTNISIEEYGNVNWATTTPDPRDSFEQENRYHDSMLFLNKINVNDFARIVPRVNWSSGITYDMYRNDYDITNPAPQTSSKTLYESRFYVVNSEFKVYICINNGTSPDFPKGQPSQHEPTFVSTGPQKAGTGSDNYIWKYLYTISPADIVKFTTEKYMPLPTNWGDSNTESVKNAAVRGRIETVVIKNRGSGYTSGTYTEDILGDGNGGKVSIVIINQQISSIEVSSPGKDYTRGVINYNPGDGGSNAEFEVIIPPNGGHGADIYRELGSYRVMVYSKYDSSSDFITQNTFSRIGIVRNPTQYGSLTNILNTNTATTLGALKLKPSSGNPGISTSSVTYPLNGEIRQSVGTAGSTAVGYVASWDGDTGVLRYYQPVGLSTISNNNFRNFDFEGNANPVTCIGMSGNTLIPDTSFTNVSSITVGGKVINLGQTFILGKANPEVEKYSGDIIYIDNRAPISRSESQKEEVKVVVEF